MGKSSKKVKSDRINALRKQYDAFLEEDKRRRDRNEYILGWLDRVRTCPTVPSIRIQDNSFEANYKGTSKESDNMVKYQAAALRPVNIKLPFIESFDESLILKEVSKKYILIPKKSPEIEKDCNMYGEQHILGINNNLDWKNKYNILEELKQNEKEEHCDFGNKDKIKSLGDVPIKYQITRETNSPINLNVKDKDEYSEKKEPEANTYREKVPDPYSINNEESFHNEQVENFNIHYNTITPTNDSATKHDELETKILQDNLEKKSMNNVHELQLGAVVESNDLKPEINEYQVNCNDLSQNSIVNNHKDKNNTTPTKINQIFYEELPQSITENPGHTNYATSLQSNIPPIEPTKLATEKDTVSEKQELENQENINISNEGINIIQSSADTNESTLYEFNSDHQPDTETTTNLNDNIIEGAEIQIQEFETEQKELFYSGDPDENYTNNEEHVAGNEDYVNNEQYSYYEATKEDTNQYATEINEHEETTEQYDPQYEKQYTNSYEENPIQNEYPTEEYAPDQNLEYQQQYYDNYEHQQVDNNIALEQQQYENREYLTSDIEHQENIADIYNYEFSSEQMTPPKTEIEPDQQLNNEKENAIDQTAVTYNEDIATSEVTQEVQNTNLK